MGEALPVLDGVALALAHLSDGVSGSRAVGAWFDVAATDDGYVSIVMGDAGAGPAGVSERLRRALAGVGSARRSTAATLEALDHAAREIPGSAGTTALCITLGPSGVVRWSSAGCAPPLAVGPDGARHLLGAPGDPLGHPHGPSFAQEEETLVAGTTRVVGASSPVGCSGIAVDGRDPFATAVAEHELAPDALAAALAEQASGVVPAENAHTLLLVHVLPAPLGQCLPADPRQLVAVRRAAAVWSAQAALPEDATADLLIHNLANDVSLNFSDHGTRIAFAVPGHVPVLDDHPLGGVTQGGRPRPAAVRRAPDDERPGRRDRRAAHRGEVHLDAAVAHALTRSLVAPVREWPR